MVYDRPCTGVCSRLEFRVYAGLSSPAFPVQTVMSRATFGWHGQTCLSVGLSKGLFRPKDTDKQVCRCHLRSYWDKLQGLGMCPVSRREDTDRSARGGRTSHLTGTASGTFLLIDSDLDRHLFPPEVGRASSLLSRARCPCHLAETPSP